MMTDIIYYLYGFKIDYLRFINNKYIFYYHDNIYIFKKVDLNEEFLTFILNNTKQFNEVIKAKNGRFIAVYNSNKYILMKVIVKENRFILIEDILRNKNNVLYTISFDNLRWLKLWKLKIDQVEEYISNHKIDINALSIINYYIGLGEISIYILSMIDSFQQIPLSFNHRRINCNQDLYDLYDVSNDIVIDHYTRDLGEYIKDLILNSRFEVEKFDFSNYEYVDKILLIARIIFPSYFFDLFDDYIINNKECLNYSFFLKNLDLNNNIFFEILKKIK